jgi:hypothetical protein
MFKYLSLVACSTLIFASCSEKKETKTISKTKIVVKTNQVVANKILDAEVSGMVCKMGCGASIRKEMLGTDAVQSCEVNYEDDRATNNIKVAFDNKKISSKELISRINSLNEKQFKVVKSEVKDIETKISEEVKTKEVKTKVIKEINSDEVQVKIPEEHAEMPNLLDLFSKLVTG